MRINLLIAGMRRAGTTMLANLLHVPPRQVALIEPNLPSPMRQKRWSPDIATAERLIVKEISGQRVESTINQFDVERTILVVRDAQAVTQSIHEWYVDHGRDDEPIQTALNRVVANAQFLVRFAHSHPDTPVYRYEDFAQDPTTIINSLQNWGLQTCGGLTQRMIGREFEVQQHGGRITAASIDRRANEQNEERVNIGAATAAKCRPYQSHFGYEDTSNTEPWLTDVFSRGWRSGGRETRCGAGSTLRATRQLRIHWPRLVRKYEIRKVNDAGCGDLGWQQQLDLSGIDYKGYDVVRWSRIKTLPCEVADFTKERLRPCDLTLCRDALIHLPNSMVNSAIKLFRQTSKYLLATSFDNVDNSNRILVPGGFSQIRLEDPPFGLGPPELRIDEPFADKYLGLWRLADE